MAKADTYTFAYNLNGTGQNAGAYDPNLAGNTYWYDLTGPTNGVGSNGVLPGANDTAQFDTTYARLNTAETGGPDNNTNSGNEGFTLGTTPVSWGTLSFLSPAFNPAWQASPPTYAAQPNTAFLLTITGGATSGLSIGGGGILVTGNTNALASATGNDVAIAVATTLIAAQTWTVNPVDYTFSATSTGTAFPTATTALTVSGSLSLGGQGANALTITGGGNTSISGVISDGGAASGIVMNNPGATLNLGAAHNLFTGGITLEAGTVSVTQPLSLGQTNSPVTFAGGTLQVTGAAFSSFNAYNVNGSGITASNGSDITYNGVPLNLNINNGANTFTFNQELAGTTSLSQFGAGAVLLAQATNSFSGGIQLAGGSNIEALDLGSLGTGNLANPASLIGNSGAIEFLSSQSITGNEVGTAALYISSAKPFGGTNNTLTLTNQGGSVTNNLVGISGGALNQSQATLVLDFNHSNVANPIISGPSSTSAISLQVNGGNVIFDANTTAAATQVFTTTTFGGGLSHISAVGGTAGQLTIVLGTYNYNTGAESVAALTQGSAVLFSGPVSNQGTAEPVSDFEAVNFTGSTNVFTAAALLDQGGSAGNYYSGYAMYGVSDFAVVTTPFNTGSTGHFANAFAGTSYIVPGSAVSGFYTESSTFPTAQESGILTTPIQTENTGAGANANDDIDGNAAAYTGGNNAYTFIRFNNPTGGFSTGGGNHMLQLLVHASDLIECSTFLVTPNVGASNVLVAVSGNEGSGISSATTQQISPTRNTGFDVELWNTDYQGNTAGMMIWGTGIGNSKGGTVGVNVEGPGMNVFATTDGYAGPTTIQGGGFLEILNNTSLGGSSTSQPSILINGGTLAAINTTSLDGTGIANGTAAAASNAHSLAIGNLGAQLMPETATTMKIDGALTGIGQLTIGGGVFTQVFEPQTTATAGGSTLHLTNVQGGGTVLLDPSAASTYSGNISVGNGAQLQMDGTYGTATSVTVNSGSTVSGSPLTTISAVTVNSGGVFFPGDLGSGNFAASSLTLAANSNLFEAFNPTTAQSTNAPVDVINLTNAVGTGTFVAAGVDSLTFVSVGTSNPFALTGTYDLLNVFGSTSAFTINGTLSNIVTNSSESTLQVGPFILTDPQVLSTYALATVAVGNNETELELLINTSVTSSSWSNPAGGTWGTPGNWGPTIVPNGPVDFANFYSGGVPPVTAGGNGAAAPIAVNLGGSNFTAGELFFQSTNSYTLSNGTIILTNIDNPGLINDQQGSHTVAAAIQSPVGLHVLVQNSTDAMTLSGGITGAGPGLLLNGSYIQVGATITPTQDAPPPANQLAVGTLILLGNQNYTGTTQTVDGVTEGGTSIFGGTLQLGNGTVAGTIPNFAAYMLLDGNLDFNEPTGTTYSFMNSFDAFTGTGSITDNGNANALIVMASPSAPAGAAVPSLNVASGTFRIGNANSANYNVTTVNGTLDLAGNNTSLDTLSGNGLLMDSTAGDNISLSIGTTSSTTFAGVISSSAGGTISFFKQGPGQLTLSGNNTFNGPIDIGSNSGPLRITTNAFSNSSLPNGPLSTITIETSNNGPLVLSNGVTLANPIVDGVGAAEFVNVPDALATAYLSGPVSLTGAGSQFRVGSPSTTSLLYMSGADTSNSFVFYDEGNMTLLNGYSMVDTAGIVVGPIILGRSAVMTNLVMDGNASITETGSFGGLAFSGTGNNGNNPSVNLTMNNSSVFNLGSGFFETEASGAAAVLNSVNLNGGTLTTGAITDSNASTGATTVTLLFNGGLLVAGGSSTNFLPLGTATTVVMNVGNGGVHISSHGHNIMVGSVYGFSSAGGGTGGLTKLGAGNLSFNASYNSAGLSTPIVGPIVVDGGGLDDAGTAINTQDNLLANVPYIQVNAGGGIGVDDGSLSDTNFLNKMTASGAPSIQSGALLLGGFTTVNGSTTLGDTVTNINFGGLQNSTNFNMDNPGGVPVNGSTVSFYNMSIGAVNDINGVAGTFGGVVSYTGTITPATVGTYANTYHLGGGGTLAMANVNALSGANSLLVENGGVVWLQTSNTYTGTTTINSNSVLDNDQANTFASEQATLMVSFLGDNGTGGGSNSLGSPTGGFGLASNTTINGGILEYVGTGDSSDLLFTVGQNGATLDSSGSGALILHNTGQEVISGTGTISFTLQGTAGTDAAPNILAGGFTPSASQTLSLVKNGSGAWEISGDSYNGGATINGGVIVLGSSNALQTGTGPLAVNSGSTLDLNGFNAGVGQLSGSGTIGIIATNGSSTLTINTLAGSSSTFSGPISDGSTPSGGYTGTLGLAVVGGGIQTLSGNSNYYAGGTTIGAGATLSLAGGNGTLGGSPVGSGAISDGGTLSWNRTDSAVFLLSQNISGAGTVTQASTGSLGLAGNNTFQGGFNQIGTLSMVQADSTTAFGTGLLTINGTADLNGFNETVGGIAGSGTITQLTSANTITLTSNGGAGSTFAGVLANTSGTVGLTVAGGVQVLAGSNTYSGPTAISGGTLVVGNGGTSGQLGSNTGTINNAGTLAYDLSSNVAVSNNISGAGGVSQWGTGTLTLTGNNSIGGTTAINAGGTLVAGSQTALSGGAVTDNGNFVVLAGTSSTNAVKVGRVTGTGNVLVGGATTGYLQLSQNTHTSTMGALVVSTGSTFDITNNSVAIQYGSSGDPIASIKALLASGYAGGAWTGTGIVSSVAATQHANSATEQVSVGYADSAADGADSTPVVGLGNASANQVLIRYAEAGDTNMDGRVNFTDLSTLISNYGASGTDWAHGNFAYGPGTNFTDLSKLISNYGTTLTPGGSQAVTDGGSKIIGISTSVRAVPNTPQTPEPTSLSLVAAGAAGLLARRRRKNTK